MAVVLSCLPSNIVYNSNRVKNLMRAPQCAGLKYANINFYFYCKRKHYLANLVFIGLNERSWQGLLIGPS